MHKSADAAHMLRPQTLHSANMLTAPCRCFYSAGMEQVQPLAMSRESSATERVDSALSRLEAMVDERLRAEAARADDLTKRLSKLERQHDELKKVAMEVEGRLERAMEYIRSLLEADQK
jgi:predicted transcriptional regulator